MAISGFSSFSFFFWLFINEGINNVMLLKHIDMYSDGEKLVQ